MTDSSARSLGRKIAFYRSRQGLSQRSFGATIDRSEAWVSQVERGLRRIDRMSLLRAVAEALDVPVAELAADTPVVAAAGSRPGSAEELRMLLSSSVVLSLSVRPPELSDPHELFARTEECWQLVHSGEYEQVGQHLASLVPAGGGGSYGKPHGPVPCIGRTLRDHRHLWGR